MTDIYEVMKRLEERIKEFPTGYISKKNIKGKTQYYRQWIEEGKLKSKYINANDVEAVREQIDERKRLEEKLKDLRVKYPKVVDDNTVYETNVVLGEDLWNMVEPTKDYKKRDLYAQIQKYVYGPERTRVCAVYGLRRTGKTTMLYQTIADMSTEDFAKTAYIKFQTTDTMDMINRDLKKLRKAGYKYIFMDEVTLMEDFIDSAALFSDIYVQMGMKIILSGTDSLGFWFARDNELYDRVRMVHTTFIPYREYSRLLGIESIDEYIRYGGTLRVGEIDFDDEELNSEEASFRDDESTRRYIDTAISKNIQHSLEFFEDGHYFRHLYDLYDAGELTGAINRIVEDMNHRFVLKVLTKDFKSSDFGITARNLRQEADPAKQTEILDIVDRKTITERLMKILDIRNKEQQTVPITQSHATLIKGYLRALDLIADCPIEAGESGMNQEERVLFAQPGMRYCQAQALVHSLMKDDYFKELNVEQKQYVANRILEEVRGRMLEDIILLETSKALGKNYSVFKLQFNNGEFDMVIRDESNNTCAIYEIKHSKECVREQAKHLMNEEMLAMTIPRFGSLQGRYVLYLGENIDTDDGIKYRNVEEFLKKLPDFTMLESTVQNETVSDATDCKKKIKELRERTGMDRKEFCEYFQIPYQMLVEWEQDDERMPEFVLRLLEYYIRMENLKNK